MDVSSLINGVVNQFIVRPTGESGYIGKNGFVFDIIGDEHATFDSDITDHFVESNYAIQDHIALRPPKFTLSGYIGELSDIFQNSFLNILTTIQSMQGIAEYTPGWTTQATQVYNKIMDVASEVGVVLNQAANIYQTFTGASTSANKQQAAYDYFVTLYMNRTLCTVETPWATWINMGIESIRILQRDDNKLVSEFSITFKQIRIVTTKKSTANNYGLSDKAQGITPIFMQGRASDSSMPVSFTAGAITGQSSFADATTVTTDALSSSFSLPTLAQLQASS